MCASDTLEGSQFNISSADLRHIQEEDEERETLNIALQFRHFNVYTRREIEDASHYIACRPTDLQRVHYHYITLRADF